ncbi:MAG: hypothetical protein KGJ09_08585 [Candidatus Omnitrophica bacterium]|nr:hypothetical protein [Candidatus Omnitrophota bacterium]MDE2010118.1 hypothetical protein [Candidatus Omnitrophota bacterium]MDE2214305.1 hypothetical protein [Candidatus Omnitrophota bacterium]MDE2231054.1 hypothetical protein [Candidatus Omnitrophota bacterium]
MKTKINFDWQTDEERLRRWVKLSPKEKMRWLTESNEFMRKVWTKKQKEIFWKLRQGNSFR